VVVDAPIEIDQGQGAGVWRPENFSVGKYQGPTTLRNALKHSLNTVTVRLAQDVGMPLISEYAKRFGIYDDPLPNYLSYALGTGETTVMRMVTAYSMIANGGRRVKQLADRQEQVLDPMTAYQITSMMEGVVQGGTAIAMREVGKPIAGKTGTTNDAKDLWFVGFSPDLVVGLYVGYDKPRSLGRAAQAGHTAVPIARDFMKLALADKPAIPFKVPADIRLVWVDAKSGLRAAPGQTAGTILEAFKPGTAPPGNYAVTDDADSEDRSPTFSPDADRAIMRPGTGGLY
jgi:penicillin-binding protein 1A